MKIFIDSADIDEIKKAKSYGILDGVTTNPSLIKKAVEAQKKKGRKLNMSNYLKEVLKVAKGTPVSLEVIGTTYKELVAEGKKLYSKFNPVAKNVYIKIPVNPSFSAKSNTHFDGIRAIKELSKKGIPVNCTLIFTPEQAMLAAKAGAKIVSPFAGRIDDYIRANNKIKFNKTDYFPEQGMAKGNGKKELHDNGIVSGIDLVEQCVEIIEWYGYDTEVLAASMRNPRQVREAALSGAHISTIPLRVIEELLSHQKTFEGMKKFTDDIVPEYRRMLRG